MSLVTTEFTPAFIDDGAFGESFRCATLEEIRVIVGNEADLLRIRLIENGKPKRARQLADGGLLHLADRKHHARERLRADPEQDVRLILRAIEPASNARTLLGLRNARVVTCCHGVTTKLLCVLAQLSELQPIVAAHAWIWRAACVILALEVRDDAAEVVAEIDDVEGDSKFRRHKPRVGRIVDRTTPLMTDARTF